MGGSGRRRRRQEQAARDQRQKELNEQFRVLLDRARPILSEAEINRVLSLGEVQPSTSDNPDEINIGNVTDEQFGELSREVQREEARRLASQQGAEQQKRIDDAKAEREAFEAEKKKAEGSISSVVNRGVVRGGALPRRGSLALTENANVFKPTLG